jgi:hypothetical protein
MLNGEFSWASGGFLDWDKYASGGRFSAEEKEACRRKGAEALVRAFTHPALIGYTWYKFCYNFAEPDAPSYGLINPQGEFNQLNAPTLKQINARLEAIACGDMGRQA